MEKECFKCHVTKPLFDFYKHSAMGDGHLNKCKQCTKRDAHNHRNENLEKVREYDRTRGKLKHRKELAAKNTRDYRKRFPGRYKAHQKVNFAIRRGVLIKTPCEVCGKEHVEAHHSDYSRPLQVTWLCHEHHKEIHLKFPEEHYYNPNSPMDLNEWSFRNQDNI